MSIDDFSRNIPRRSVVIVVPITPIHPLPPHRNDSVVTGSIVQLYIYVMSHVKTRLLSLKQVGELGYY